VLAAGGVGLSKGSEVNKGLLDSDGEKVAS